MAGSESLYKEPGQEMTGCLRLEETQRTETRREAVGLLGKLPYSDAPNLGDKIVSGLGHALLLPPSSGSLGESMIGLSGLRRKGHSSAGLHIDHSRVISRD